MSKRAKPLMFQAEMNSREIDVSIVIVSWNAKAHLMDCLESLQTQGPKKEMEIIVVDNASSDGSPDAVRALYQQVKVIETGSNLGFAKANNIGIRECNGKYVALLNSDVTILDGCLNGLQDYMNSNPGVGLCAPRLLNRDMTVQYSCRNFPTIWRLFCGSLRLDKLPFLHRLFEGEEIKTFAYDRETEVDAVSGAFMFARREVFEKVGLLDERFFMYSEDVDWCKRLRDAGWKVAFFPEAEAIHYGGGSSSGESTRFYIEKERAVFLYWEKHHSGLSQFILSRILFLHHFVRIVTGGLLYLVKPSRRPSILPVLNKNLAGIRLLVSGRI